MFLKPIDRRKVFRSADHFCDLEVLKHCNSRIDFGSPQNWG